MELEIIGEGDSELGKSKHIKHEHEEMESSEESSAAKKLWVLGNIVVVEDSKHPEANSIGFEDIGLGPERPEYQQKVAHPSPDWEGNFELRLRFEVDIIVNKQKYNSNQHKQHNTRPDPQSKIIRNFPPIY